MVALCDCILVVHASHVRDLQVPCQYRRSRLGSCTVPSAIQHSWPRSSASFVDCRPCSVPKCTAAGGRTVLVGHVGPGFPFGFLNLFMCPCSRKCSRHMFRLPQILANSRQPRSLVFDITEASARRLWDCSSASGEPMSSLAARWVGDSCKLDGRQVFALPCPFRMPCCVAPPLGSLMQSRCR